MAKKGSIPLNMSSVGSEMGGEGRILYPSGPLSALVTVGEIRGLKLFQGG